MFNDDMRNTEEKDKPRLERIIESLLLYFMFIVFSLMSTKYSIPGGEIIRWCTLVLLILYALVNAYKHNSKIYFFQMKYIMIILAVLPMAWTWFDKPYGVLRFISFMLMIISFIVFIVRDKVQLKQIEKYLKVYIVVLYCLNIVNISIYFFSSNGWINGRFAGIYGNVNTLSPICVFTLVCSFYMAQVSRYKLVHYMFSVSSILLVFLTGSRAGLITLGAALLAYPLIFIRDKQRLKALKRIIYYIILFAISIYAINYLNIDSISRLQEQGLSRQFEWTWGIFLFKLKPLFGWGYGMVGYNIVVDPALTDYVWGVHSSYLVILIETGIWGALCFCMFFIITLVPVFQAWKKSISRETLFICTCTLLLINLFINAVSESFLMSVGSPLSLSFWFTLIILSRYSRLVLKSSADKTSHINGGYND